jgi:hypothetical protein
LEEFAMRRLLLGIAVVALMLPADAARRVPADLSGVRGFNYTPAEVTNREERWLEYDPAVTERDFNYAKRLQLNQVRFMVTAEGWASDKTAFRKNILNLVRTAHAHGMGVMPTILYPRNEEMDETAWPKSRAFIADLVATLGKEPGLLMWDVQNEPDCCQLPAAVRSQRMKHAIYMAKLFHELDPVTPVTIGFTYVAGMIEAGDAVDVLSFHDYSTTQAVIRANIEKAKAYAAETHKPLINSEIACIARANPYDIALEEYSKAHVGWYIWELMITHYWGNVHGVFYPDGTVRDPSIPAAILGFYRNRGDKVVDEVPDRENHLAEAVANNRKWLAAANPDWSEGLNLAEVSAHLAESAQIVAMHDLPTRQIRLLRAAAPDMAALHALLAKLTAALEPYQLAPDDPRHSKPVNVTPPPPAK